MSDQGASGVDRLDRVFAEAREVNRGVLMPFVVGGHPAGTSLPDLLRALERGGAGVVEIGFPFSDPVADGGVIAAAMHEVLQTGRTVEQLLSEVRSVRSELSIGIVAMVSVSLVEKLGGAAFVRTLADAGFDGVIVPDMPLEESARYREAASRVGLGFTLLIAPTSQPSRAIEIAKASTGFVYLMARTGITGEQTQAPLISKPVAGLREAGSPPIAVGFGISSPEHVRAVVAVADAAIVGSALVRRLADSTSPAAEAEAFCRALAAGLDRS